MKNLKSKGVILLILGGGLIVLSQAAGRTVFHQLLNGAFLPVAIGLAALGAICFIISFFWPRWTVKRVARLKDQALIARIARSNAAPEVREKAVLRLKDQSVLRGIVKSDDALEIRKIAARRLTDQRFLGEIAAQDEYGEIRKAVLNKITDQQVLIDIAEKTAFRDTRRAALKRIADPEAASAIGRKIASAVGKNNARPKPGSGRSKVRHLPLLRKCLASMPGETRSQLADRFASVGANFEFGTWIEPAAAESIVAECRRRGYEPWCNQDETSSFLYGAKTVQDAEAHLEVLWISSITVKDRQAIILRKPRPVH